MLPKIDVQVAATVRSDQGGDLGANWAAPNSATVGLNRAFAGIAGNTVTVNLIEPGTLYGDRVNQVELAPRQDPQVRADADQRRLRHLQPDNAAPVLTYNQTFVPNQAVSTWLRPTSVLQARFVKFSAQVDF